MLLFDLERDFEATLADLELLRDREDADLGDVMGLLDLRDPADDDRDLERDERLPGLSILLDLLFCARYTNIGIYTCEDTLKIGLIK